MVNAKRYKAYGALAGVFLLGSVAGASASWALSQREFRALAGDRSAFEKRRLHALSRELDLSDEQRDQIAAIFEKHHDERRELTRDVFEKCGEPLREHKAKLTSEIHAVLKPEQRDRYDALMREHEGRFFKRKGRRGH